MSKLILSLSLLGITILLLFGLLAPESSIMWMASASAGAALLRLGMIAGLLALMATNPPRNIYLRIIIGISAAVLASWAIAETYQNNMQLLDTFAALSFSISAGLAVVELDESTAEAAKAAPTKTSTLSHQAS